MKPAHERWSIRRCGSTPRHRRPPICGPKARLRADIYRFDPMNVKRAVTVDMGAVRFIYNGADVMAPGIVDADPGIRAADIVWVRDEKNGRPLAIGRAIMDGPTMAREEKGKAIQTIHHVGDEIWRLGEEEL